MADTLDTTFVQPFQGPQGAEHALQLAAVLAPRINLGSRPLQAGEGEGLRNLFGAFGSFAQQKRQRAAEGQLLSGIQDVMAGKAPISTLSVSDLPDTMQRTLMEQVAKRGLAVGEQTQKQSALDKIMATAQQRWGQNIPPPAPITEDDLTARPTMMNPSYGLGATQPTPPPPARTFTPQEFGAIELLHPGLGKNLQEQLEGQKVIVPPGGVVYDKQNNLPVFTNTRQEQSVLHNVSPGQTVLNGDGQVLFHAPDKPMVVGPGSTVLGPTGPLYTAPQRPQVVPPGGTLVGPEGPSFKAQDRPMVVQPGGTLVQPDGTQGVVPLYKAPERENSKARSQFRDMVDSYKEEFSTLQDIPDQRWGYGKILGQAGQSARQQAEASAKAMDTAGNSSEARAMRQAIREHFGPEIKTPVAPTGASNSNATQANQVRPGEEVRQDPRTGKRYVNRNGTLVEVQ